MVAYNFRDITGIKFNFLTPISYQRKGEHRGYWLCRCDCGQSTYVVSSKITKGTIKSCGCYKKIHDKLSRITHGRSRENIYHIWFGIKSRCTNPNNNAYKSYGGRGITICERWSGENGFTNFISDMGERPSIEYSIDRIDNNMGYEPSNCRWASRTEQSRNTRSNRHITLDMDGVPVKKTMAEWAIIGGVGESTLHARLKNGMEPKMAVFKPVRGRRVVTS